MPAVKPLFNAGAAVLWRVPGEGLLYMLPQPAQVIFLRRRLQGCT